MILFFSVLLVRVLCHPQRAPPLTYFTITECMTTSVILAYPMENDQFSNDSSRIRTYDRLLRRQLLYPAELLSQDLVPIASDPEPGRESQQWSLNHLYNIKHMLVCVKGSSEYFLIHLENFLIHQWDQDEG